MENGQLKFTEWVGENHYNLYDIKNGVYYWENSFAVKTTSQLLKDFKDEQ
jgi:hypothetical protein